MYILAVDTCDAAGSAAVLKNTRVLGEINIDSPVTHSERLMDSIDFLLRRLNMEIRRIDGYAIAAGPGSFTGIRIGMSTVKSFSFSSGKPIAPVSRLKALAYKLSGEGNRLICPFLDAKKNQVYAALYEKQIDGVKINIPEGSYYPDEFLSRLPSRQVIHFIGSGTDAYRDSIRHRLKDRAVASGRSPFAACETGRLGYEMLKLNQGKDYREAAPIYLRKSQAEEKH
jgi:tRNA threonylcarbamoyladenosine biosynthesis protein TsaB